MLSLSSISIDTVLSLTWGAKPSEESQISQSRLPVLWESRFRNLVRHGFYRTRSGKRRRYRCVECGKTFSTTKGTLY